MKLAERLLGERKRGTVIFLALLAVCSFIFILAIALQQAAQNQPVYETSAVRRGDLAKSASGSGTSISITNADLNFPISGIVGVLNVQPGDKVKKGDVLAVLDGIDELKVNVGTKEIEVQSAQEALSDLENGSVKTVAQAEQDLASAQQGVAEAKSFLRHKGQGRCEEAVTLGYSFQYFDAVGEIHKWGQYIADRSSGYGIAFLTNKLIPLYSERDLAYVNWMYCEGYTDLEVETSEVDLLLAEAELRQAEKAYQGIEANNGLDEDVYNVAKAGLVYAEKQLAVAKMELDGATLIAPIDGTVISVAGSQGDEVDTSTFISISDLENPYVEITVDQTDLDNIRVGCDAEVVFSAFPKKTFPGTVTQVSPSLVTVDSFSSVQGLVELVNSKKIVKQTLPLDLEAAVEVVCEQVTDVLLVPEEALFDLDSDHPYLYVLDSNGEPEKRDVEVGLVNFTFAEIRSGVSEGEKVITKGIEGQ